MSMTHYIYIVIIFFLFSAVPPVLAVEVSLSPIFIDRAEEGTSYGRSFFELLPLVSPEEVLNYTGGIRFISRGAFSLQQDLSIRSSGFGENKILFEGINIGNPQTHHLSLDLPFTSADLEGIVLDKDNNRINFRLKKPAEKGGEIEISGGIYGFSHQLISLNIPANRLCTRMSFESTSSSAYRPDRDFTAYKVSLISYYKTFSSRLKFIFGLSKKDFGAAGFYAAPWYNQEEEHTQNLFLSIQDKWDFSSFRLMLMPFFNRHFDKFYLDRNNPALYTNYHTTYSYGLSSKLDLKNYNLAFEFDVRKEKITSTRLGNHKRDIYKGKLVWGPFVLDNLSCKLNFSENCYSHWGLQEEYEAETDYLIKDRKNKLQMRLARFFSMPGFTELYYDSPSNKGNKRLSFCRTDNIYFGWIHKSSLEYSLGVFYRWIKNRVDWLNKPTDSFYQAQNIGTIKAKGIESRAYISFPSCRPLAELEITYDFTNELLPLEEGIYKYSHIFVKHQIISIIKFRMKKDINFIVI